MCLWKSGGICFLWVFTSCFFWEKHEDISYGLLFDLIWFSWVGLASARFTVGDFTIISIILQQCFVFPLGQAIWVQLFYCRNQTHANQTMLNNDDNSKQLRRISYRGSTHLYLFITGTNYRKLQFNDGIIWGQEQQGKLYYVNIIEKIPTVIFFRFLKLGMQSIHSLYRHWYTYWTHY